MKITPLPQRLFFLEAVRTFAAFYVFIYHVLQRIEPVNSILKNVFSFGQEVVILFFVLSGFVIYYSQILNKDTFQIKKYIIARVIRIYPVFLFSLLVSYVSEFIIHKGEIGPDISSLINNIFMLQDIRFAKPGVLVSPYMGNSPLWSLSYEWWSYILFLPIIFIKPNYQIHVVAAISILALIVYLFYPNQVCLWCMYFLIWWSGAEAAKKYISTTCFVNYSMYYLIAIVLILSTYGFFFYAGALRFGLFPILFLRHFFTALLFYFFLIKINISNFKITENNFLVVLAPYSYAFYILQYPILNIFDQKHLFNMSGLDIPLLFLTIGTLTWIAEDVIHKYISKGLKIFPFINYSCRGKKISC